MARFLACAFVSITTTIAAPAFAQDASPLPTTLAVAATTTVTYLPPVLVGADMGIAPARWLAFEFVASGGPFAIDFSVEARVRSRGPYDRITLGVATDLMFGLPPPGQYFFSSAEIGWEHRSRDRLYMLLAGGPRVFLGDHDPRDLGALPMVYDLDAKSRAHPVLPFLRFAIGGWVL